MQHRVRRGLIALAAFAAALVPLSAAQGGAFPGDNGPIAFTCGADICKINPDGTSRTPFLTGASDPSWSSDETTIAFVDTAAADIAIANVKGTGRQALGAGASASQPSLSFSGAQVAFTKTGDVWTILTNTGGSPVNLTSNAADDKDPVFSPDGSQIAFAEQSATTGYDIWAIPANGGSPVQLTTTIGNEVQPTYSPSGATIVYTAGGELFSVSSSGGVPQDLGVAGSSPSFSPDGSKIAFVNAAGKLAAMTAAVNGAQTVIDNNTDSGPDWEAIDASNGPPENVSYPTINLTSGDTGPVLGHFLTSSVGSWQGAFPISYKYQWKRCDAADPVNGVCVEISGATASFYTPTLDDVGKRLRVQVTATNPQGSASQNSEVSAVVTALAPHNRATPQILGGNTVDAPLSLLGGTWEGSTPITFTYWWRRCNPVGDLDSCVPIPGATQATYTPTVQDIGFSIRVWITGTNIAGSDFVITNHTFPIVDKPHFAPSAQAAPGIVGTSGIGRQLTANVGAFGGDSPIKTAFTWQRCDATGEACHVISTAKQVVYFPTAADVGYTLRLVVTATNVYGSYTARSDHTEPIAALPPHRPGRHIVGTTRPDYKAGGGFDDSIWGRAGNDTLLGGAGDDKIFGGPGNDIVTGGSGADRLYGGAGSDTINAQDGERDVVDCGAGRDRAIADSFDKTVNCEVVDTPSAPAPPK